MKKYNENVLLHHSLATFWLLLVLVWFGSSKVMVATPGPQSGCKNSAKASIILDEYSIYIEIKAYSNSF